MQTRLDALLNRREAMEQAIIDALKVIGPATARLHRTGQTQSVVVHHLVAKGTIDERIMAVLATKGDMQQALLDALK